MKRMIGLLLVMLLLLSGCGTQESKLQEREESGKKQVETAESTIKSEVESDVPVTGNTELTMEMERAVYDPSVERMAYFIRNDSPKTVELGDVYRFEKKTAAGWIPLPWKPNTGFHDMAYVLAPGGTMAFTCGTNALLTRPDEGTYRLVKEVEGTVLAAEFEIGESIYTAETPYGFEPLEELPADHSAASVGDMDVVFTAEGVKNPEAVETFLFKTGLGVDCQLRTVQDYGEGTPMVIDVIYEADHYLWRMWSDGYVSEQRFSYIVTDGEALYLANGADWENQQRFGGNTVLPLLIPEGVTPEMVQAVEEQTAARKESNVTRYKVWSAPENGGVWSAALWDYSDYPDYGAPFTVSWRSTENNGGRGSTYDLNDWDGPEIEITAIEWRFGGNLRLTCLTADGRESILEFDPETETLSSLAGEIPTDGN